MYAASENGRSMRGSITLDLEPLDVLFFRGGRPFDAAQRATSGAPLPQTVAGAVRTWLLRSTGTDLNALAESIRNGTSFAEATAAQGRAPGSIGRIGIRGPWFVKKGDRLVPTPATVEVDDEGSLHRLDPLVDDLPGWAPQMEGMLPLWRRGRSITKPRDGYLTAGGLQRFLAGDTPRPHEIIHQDSVFGAEDRVGIEVDAHTRTVGERMIYAVRLLRLCPDVTLSVDLVGMPEDLAVCPCDEDVIPLGGEAKRVIVRRVRANGGWPEAPRVRGDGRLFLLTTPAPFGGWRPPGCTPVAAAVPGYVPVSGWDLARGRPKPNRFAVAAGSVYFMNHDADLVGRDGSLCGDEDAAAGWGAYIEGVWNYA